VEYKIVIGRDAAEHVYRVIESEIDGLWLEAVSRDALIAAISEVAAAYVRRGAASGGTVRIYEEVGDDRTVEHAA
jgi:DNA-binding NarL/FixJ family response regulator